MRAEPNPVRDYWSRRATSFDRLYQQTSYLERTINRVFRPGIYVRAAVVVDEIKRLGAPAVLDVGSGSGANSVAFASAGASSVVGVDFAEPMLDLARERAAREGVALRCRFERADFIAWEPKETFDLVAALGVFDYVEEARPFWAKMLGISRHTVVGSFPSAGVRGWIRKMRYGLNGCPLFLFDEQEVEAWTRGEGWNRFEVPYRNSSGFIAVAGR